MSTRVIVSFLLLTLLSLTQGVPANDAPSSATQMAESDTAVFGRLISPTVITEDVRSVSVVGDQYVVHSWSTNDLNFSRIHGDAAASRWIPEDRECSLGAVTASSGQSSSRLAVIECSKAGSIFVDILDAATAKRVCAVDWKAVCGPRRVMGIQQLVGFTSEDKEFVIATTARSLVFIDVQSGETKRTVSMNSPDAFDDGASWAATKVTPKGDTYVLCMGDRIIAKDREGKERWRITAGKNHSIYSYPRQPAVSEAIAVYSSDSRKLFAIRISEGKPGAELPNLKYSDVLAVSGDATKVAVVTDDGVAIRSVETNTDVVLSPRQTEVGALFSADGAKVWCIAAPKFKSGDLQKNTITVARDSSTMSSFDVTTGKRVDEIKLTKPR